MDVFFNEDGDEKGILLVENAFTDLVCTGYRCWCGHNTQQSRNGGLSWGVLNFAVAQTPLSSQNLIRHY